MTEYRIKRIYNLNSVDFNILLKESKEEGFRFVERLLKDYQDKINRFDYPGEALYGVFDESGALVSIGGLNIDPFSKESNIGRLRRFYVRKDHRRKGIGSFLVKEIITEAKKNFHVLVLHTDTEQGDCFYTSLGFVKGNVYPNSSHYLKFIN